MFLKGLSLFIPYGMGRRREKLMHNTEKCLPGGKTILDDELSDDCFFFFVSGAPNENIVQNHLNIALLNAVS